ncbi:MAG: hypothetical protein EpisKO_40810 [Epibacterium sp.]
MLDTTFTEDILRRIQEAPTPREKKEVLKDCAKGRPCVVLSCGPSLNEYTPKELRDLCKDSVVISVKQAFDYVPDVSDFLILNTWNYQKYDFAHRRPIILYEKGPTDPPVFGTHDIEFDLPNPTDLSQQLARSGNYDDYAFDVSDTRPWGPGVLYEIGFYLAEYIGVKSIYTLGWDVGAKNTSVMPHFYDRPSPHRTRTLARSREIRNNIERARFLHENGVIYNKPRIIPEEVDACANASGDWFTWLASRGIDLHVVSRVAEVDPRVPRTRLEKARLR